MRDIAHVGIKWCQFISGPYSFVNSFHYFIFNPRMGNCSVLFLLLPTKISVHSRLMITCINIHTAHYSILYFVFRSLSALSAYHSGGITPMKIRTESQSNLRLYSGSPTRSEKELVSISSFYYKERVSR